MGALCRRRWARCSTKSKGRSGKFPALWVVVIVAVVLYLGASMVYTVGVDEVGIIQRFGKYDRTTTQGLNFKLPGRNREADQGQGDDRLQGRVRRSAAPESGRSDALRSRMRLHWIHRSCSQGTSMWLWFRGSSNTASKTLTSTSSRSRM